MILVLGGILAAIFVFVALEVWSVHKSTADLESRIRSIRGNRDGEEED